MINPYPNILQFFALKLHLMFLQIFLFCSCLPWLMLSFHFPFSLYFEFLLKYFSFPLSYKVLNLHNKCFITFSDFLTFFKMFYLFFSLFTCFALPNASASLGIFFVITEPAAVSTLSPISTGATIIELLPIKAFFPILVLCLFFPS